MVIVSHDPGIARRVDRVVAVRGGKQLLTAVKHQSKSMVVILLSGRPRLITEQLPININNATDKTGCDEPLFPFGYGLTYGEPSPEILECSQ